MIHTYTGVFKSCKERITLKKYLFVGAWWGENLTLGFEGETIFQSKKIVLVY